MSYVLGYFVADGCICFDKNRKNRPYMINITSKDKNHLHKIRKALGSNHKISSKSRDKFGYFQIQIRNQLLCSDLISLGIRPRKTYNLGKLYIPDKYFADFTRGFFDGDGTVYIYKVNGVPQIKAGFISVSWPFFRDFSQRLCVNLNITEKTIHKTISKVRLNMPQYNSHFYIDDCERLYDFMYKNAPIFLERKKKIFEKWKSIKRRHYIKENYPSKIGWYLNKKMEVN